MRAWGSKKYLVQLYDESAKERGMYRLSINRSQVKTSGRWADRITWDELQSIKKQVGFGDWWAYEAFPPESKVVNVSNIRHLWLFQQRPAKMTF